VFRTGGGGTGLSGEQLVGPVVYGLHVPEQPVSEPAAETAAPELSVPAEVDSGKFTVRLTNFTGPFDLLLQLIGKHKLDVTEIALHTVTDDFIAYIRAMGDDWDLGETSEFLLVAATLLDLKAARLLPSAEVEDEDDLALLEAGDLLFARLLQYKAYKEAAAVIADLEGIGTRRWPRAVTLESRYAEALPDLVLGIGPERLLKLALKQFLPKPGPPEVSIAHIHQVRVSVREHATLIRDRLRRAGSATFGLLIADCESTLEVVARFLALLELYREGLIDFEQPVSLEEMTIRWIGGDDADLDLDIDDYEGTAAEPDTAAQDPDELTDPDAAADLSLEDLATDDLDRDADDREADDRDAGDRGPIGRAAADFDEDDDLDEDEDDDDFDEPESSGAVRGYLLLGRKPDADDAQTVSSADDDSATSLEDPPSSAPMALPTPVDISDTSGEAVGSWDEEAEVVEDDVVEGGEAEAARADLGDVQDPAPDPADESALGEAVPGEFGGPGVGMSGAGPHTADRVSIDEEQA
jgi:segregation and condensation protein A